MRVVVTGATGNVGTCVVERLAADDTVTEIVGIARRHPDWSPPNTTWEQLDIVQDALEPAFDGADAVVHLAWVFQPTHDPLVTWENNVVGAWRVFDAVAGARVPALDAQNTTARPPRDTNSNSRPAPPCPASCD